MSEFKITGPGEYRTRDGRRVLVSLISEQFSNEPHAIGLIYGETDTGMWPLNGCNIHDEELDDDIIGPWVESVADDKLPVLERHDTTRQIAQLMPDGTIQPVKPQHGAGEPVKTLRDEYAMAAMIALTTAEERSGISNTKDFAEYIARTSFTMADAMMAARQKGGAV